MLLVLGLNQSAIVAVVAPTLLLFVTQLGMLIWFLASVKTRLQLADDHTKEHCDEIKEVNGRLIKLETLMDTDQKNGIERRKNTAERRAENRRADWEWRDNLDGRITRLETTALGDH